MEWENDSFISEADLYIAYRKAKVDMYYERDHVTAVKFSDYEEQLDANLKYLLAQLNSHDPTWMQDLDFVGEYSYVPKSLEPADPKQDYKPPSFIHSDQDAAWQSLAHHCQHQAKFRLIGLHPIAFHVVSALWIQKVGHKYDGVLKDCAYGSRLRRKRTKAGKLGDPSRTSLGSFRPYSYGFRAWRENGLGSIQKALDEGKSVIAVTADLRRFYHDVSPEYLLHPEYLNTFGIELTYDQRKFTTQLIEAFRTWAANTPEHGDMPLRGIPVGLSAPRVIANALLAGFDAMIQKELTPLYYGRYVDDVLLVLDNQRGMASDEDVWRYISDRSRKMVEVGEDEGDPAYWVHLPYAPNSKIRFAGNKQKVFSLKGSSGKSLLNAISLTVAQTSSDWRLLPDLPGDAAELANDFITAGQDATEEVDNLRKSDGMSLRRLAFALRLRNFEAVERDLRPEQWRSHRDAFFSLALDHVLTVPGLFAYGPYLSRLVGLAVACRDWGHASAVVSRLISLFKILSETAITPHTLQQLEHAKTQMLDSCLEATFKAIGNGKYTGAELKSLLEAFDEEMWFIAPSAKKCLAYGKQLYASDLAREAFREAWLDDEDDEDFHAVKKTEWNAHLPLEIVDIFRLDDAKEFLGKTRLGNKAIPRAIAFPTRPFDPGEIVLIDQDCLTDTNRLHRWVKALRGSELLLEEAGVGIASQKEVGSLVVISNNCMPATPMVAVPCFETKAVSWVASVSNTLDPDSDRYFRLNRLVNDVISAHQRVQYLVLPELALPRRWFNRLAHKLSHNGISLIAGLEYLHYKPSSKKTMKALAELAGTVTGFVSNQVRASLVTDVLGYRTHMIYVQEKAHPAPAEERDLRTIAGKLLKPKNKPVKPIIQHGSLRFGILICSELTNIDYRQPLRGQVDALFVPEWNKDTNSFASLVEASALDIHCFVVQVNNRTYGDCRIRAPYAEPYQRDVLRVKGGEMDYIVIGKLDVPSLRAFQSSFRSPEGGIYKPVPDGFLSAPGRKVRPSI